jgi:hypothetical protein
MIVNRRTGLLHLTALTSLLACGGAARPPAPAPVAATPAPIAATPAPIAATPAPDPDLAPPPPRSYAAACVDVPVPVERSAVAHDPNRFHS